MKTLYVSDLDGTLMDANARISAQSRSMLNAAIADGALFTIATARTPATVDDILCGVDMRLDAIVMTGAARWNHKTGRYSHVRHFPEHLARAVMDAMTECRYPSFVYTLTDNLIHIYRLGPMTASEREFIAEREHTPYKRVEFDTSESGNTWGGPRPDPSQVILFYSLQSVEQLERFYPEIERRAPGVNALHYIDTDPNNISAGMGTLEIFAPDATKANAVREYARELGVDRTVVFGDNVNDLSMMSVADLAIAPANAIPSVRSMATEVIGHHTSDAVARYILNHTRT